MTRADTMRRVRGYAGMAGLVLLAIILGETPPVQALDQLLKQWEPWGVAMTGGIGTLGFVLMMGGILKLLMDQDESLSHAEVEDVERSVRLAARPVALRASSYDIWGSTVGRKGSEQFSLRELNQAWKSGAVWRHPVWRRRSVTIIGALMMVVGLLGFFAIVGPPWLKVLIGGALFYTTACLVRGFWQA